MESAGKIMGSINEKIQYLNYFKKVKKRRKNKGENDLRGRIIRGENTKIIIRAEKREKCDYKTRKMKKIKIKFCHLCRLIC